MATKGAQLALSFAAAAQYTRAQFFVSPSNAAALALIETWPRWPDKVLLLIGPKGSGKTHLAHIFKQNTHANPIPIADICQITPATIAAAPVLVIEDVDRGLAAELEAPLFHLLNLIRETGQGLLLTAAAGPDNWGISTPDLLSRLRLAPMVRLNEPDEPLFRAVLQKIIHERQLIVEDAAFDYIVMRLERSLDAAQRMLERMDQLSLQHQRAITRNLAAEIFTEERGVFDALDGDNFDDEYIGSTKKRV